MHVMNSNFYMNKFLRPGTIEAFGAIGAHFWRKLCAKFWAHNKKNLVRQFLCAQGYLIRELKKVCKNVLTLEITCPQNICAHYLFMNPFTQPLQMIRIAAHFSFQIHFLFYTPFHYDISLFLVSILTRM